MNTQQYDFTLAYMPGQHMHIADLLSRSQLKRTEPAEFDYISAVAYIPIRSDRLNRLRKATQDDECMQMQIVIVQERWHDEKPQVSLQVAAHFHCRNNIAIYDGLAYKGSSHCTYKDA